MECPPLHVNLLGGFLLVDGHTPVTHLHAPRLQALLALLLLKCDTPQPRHYLALRLWPDSSEAQAQTNLRNLLHQLRHLLPRADLFLALDRHTLQWRTDSPFILDVAAFERALVEANQAGKRGDPRALRTHLEEAIAQYQGELLPTCYDDWILPERERLRLQYLRALEQLITLLEGELDYGSATRYAQRLVAAEPLHETAYLWLMRLQMLQGNRAAALHTFQVCTEVLQRDLAVEPGETLRAAYAQIVALEQHPPLRKQAGGRSLIGRVEEWRKLQACWRRAAAGRPLLFLLSGEIGIGKSRLAEELLHWAGQQYITHARAQCYAAEGEMLYAPVISWLHQPPFQAAIERLSSVWRSELARLAPELLDNQTLASNPDPITEPWQRRRFFEGLARAVLGAEQPILLVIDDLHWCDQATLAWIRFLMHVDSRSSLLLVCTARSVELAMAEGVQGLLNALREQGQLAELELGPLDETAIAALATQVLGRALDPDELALLLRESAGNPLFIVETACTELGSERTRACGGPDLAHTPESLALPPRMSAALSARLDRLSPGATELVELAASIGMAFSAKLLARASGFTEDDLVHGLDELWRYRIIRERGDQEYDFSHDKLRELVYQRLSKARRRQFHRAVAEALAPEYGDTPTWRSATLAGHYMEAGHLEEAVRAYIGAALASQRVYANKEAANACRAALALIEHAPPHALAPPLRAELTIAAQHTLAEVLHAMAQFAEARVVCEATLSLISDKDCLSRARLYQLMANTWRAQGMFDEADAMFRRAEQVLSASSGSVQTDHWQTWVELQLDFAEALLWQGRVDTVGEDELDQLQQAVMRYGTTAHQSRLLMLRLIAAFWTERCVIDTRALERIDRIIALSDSSGDSRLIAMGAWLAGQSRLLRHETEMADAQFQRALGLAEQCGDMPLQARCLGSLSIAARCRDDPKLAQAYTERGGALAEAYGFNDVLGTIEASRAWLAWRAADLVATERHGRRALECWRYSPILFPFQWTARLPLLAAALAHGAVSEIVEYMQELLAPTQQRLPVDLESALVSAAKLLAEGHLRAAQNGLEGALTLAQNLSFL